MNLNREKFLEFRCQVVVVFTVCFSAWMALNFAEAYAWYLLDLEVGRETDPFRYFGRRDTLYNPINLLFFIPFAVVLLSRHAVFLRSIWLCIAVILLVMSLMLIGEGGDRKGCKTCFSVLLIYYIVLPVPALLSSAWGIFRHFYQSRAGRTC